MRQDVKLKSDVLTDWIPDKSCDWGIPTMSVLAGSESTESKLITTHFKIIYIRYIYEFLFFSLKSAKLV